MPRPANRILAELAAATSGEFTAAKSLPPALYHAPSVHAREIASIFRSQWICAGRLAEIAEPGDYLCLDLVDAPLFVVRRRDGTVAAFSNVCRHRGARLLDDRGHVTRISCPYHSWTYDLDGQLVGAPFMHSGFDVGSFRLPQLATFEWQGFVYVNADPDAQPPDLGELSANVGDYRMADYVPVHACTETWATNWKCLVENFMDAYHLHRVHRETFAAQGSSESGTTLSDGDEASAWHYVDESSGAKSVQAHPDNTWLSPENRHRTWLINVFPSHVFQLQPDFLWSLSILPLGIGETRFRWSLSVPAEILNGAKDRQAHVDGVVAFLERVNAEDRVVVENVFRATASPLATAGPLSWLERNVWSFARYLARRLVD